jgi:hypothetical protein
MPEGDEKIIPCYFDHGMEILPNHQTTFVVDRSQVIIVQAVGQTANLTYTAMSVAVIGRVEEIDVQPARFYWGERE